MTTSPTSPVVRSRGYEGGRYQFGNGPIWGTQMRITKKMLREIKVGIQEGVKSVMSMDDGTIEQEYRWVFSTVSDVPDQYIARRNLIQNIIEKRIPSHLVD